MGPQETPALPEFSEYDTPPNSKESQIDVKLFPHDPNLAEKSSRMESKIAGESENFPEPSLKDESLGNSSELRGHREILLTSLSYGANREASLSQVVESPDHSHILKLEAKSQVPSNLDDESVRLKSDLGAKTAHDAVEAKITRRPGTKHRNIKAERGDEGSIERRNSNIFSRVLRDSTPRYVPWSVGSLFEQQP